MVVTVADSREWGGADVANPTFSNPPKRTSRGDKRRTRSPCSLIVRESKASSETHRWREQDRCRDCSTGKNVDRKSASTSATVGAVEIPGGLLGVSGVRAAHAAKPQGVQASGILLCRRQPGWRHCNFRKLGTRGVAART